MAILGESSRPVAWAWAGVLVLCVVNQSAAEHVLSVANPTGRAVLQRDNANLADVLVEGSFSGTVTKIEARAVTRSGYSGVDTGWRVIDSSPTGGAYSSSFSVGGGWYDLEVRALNGVNVLEQKTIERVGVGEVFITAGQSNAANHGGYRQTPTDDRVSAYNAGIDVGSTKGWQFADEFPQAGNPSGGQPNASGDFGSPWPMFGDLVAAQENVPVGFYSVAQGSTSALDWQPPGVGSNYELLSDAVQFFGAEGFRAVLWHQGESDAGQGTSTADYVTRLQNVIEQSRIDAGWDILWGVALASYLPNTNPVAPDGTVDPDITNGQLQVISEDSLVFLGAATDDLGDSYRNPGDRIHFNPAGLQIHADRWLVAVNNSNVLVSIPEPSACTECLIGAGVCLAAMRVRSSAKRGRKESAGLGCS